MARWEFQTRVVFQNTDIAARFVSTGATTTVGVMRAGTCTATVFGRIWKLYIGYARNLSMKQQLSYAIWVLPCQELWGSSIGWSPSSSSLPCEIPWSHPAVPSASTLPVLVLK
ncbi:ATP synthase F(0) complex subunit C1, mitochondrial [Lemmus lemmus]